MATERPSGDCGRTLREARERRGTTLRQIANITKISISALEALERNDLSRLPGGIFSRAFVRSYASEVGLDPEEAVREFMAQFPQDSVTAGHPTSEHVEDTTGVESDRQMARTFLGLIALSVPVAAVVLYFGIAGREAAVSPPPELPANVRSIPESPTAPARPAESPASRAAASEPTERIAVELSTTRPCWIAVTVDGERIVERILQPGDRQTFEARRDVVLTAGDAAALTMTLNGAEAKPLGRPGQVVTAQFNLTNFKEYLARR